MISLTDEITTYLSALVKEPHKITKIMQMLSRAYLKTLTFSFFSEQGHTYENI